MGVCVYILAHMSGVACKWRSEDNLWEPILFFSSTMWAWGT